MAFVKGKSGNPGGRSTKDKVFADAVRIAVNRAAKDDPEGRKKLMLLADKLVDFALAGEGWAMAQVADRLDGKPAQEQALTVTRVSAKELPDDELAAIAIGGGEGDTLPPLDPAQLN